MSGKAEKSRQAKVSDKKGYSHLVKWKSGMYVLMPYHLSVKIGYDISQSHHMFGYFTITQWYGQGKSNLREKSGAFELGINDDYHGWKLCWNKMPRAPKLITPHCRPLNKLLSPEVDSGLIRLALPYAGDDQGLFHQSLCCRVFFIPNSLCHNYFVHIRHQISTLANLPQPLLQLGESFRYLLMDNLTSQKVENFQCDNCLLVYCFVSVTDWWYYQIHGKRTRLIFRSKICMSFGNKRHFIGILCRHSSSKRWWV